MPEVHIQSAFDRDLEAIQAMIMKMGGIVETQLLDSVQALEERDDELATHVRDTDKQVDLLEEQINLEAARVIAMRAPTATDLRTVLTVLKISNNLERIGDYAKNLAKRSVVLAQMPQISGAAGSIRRDVELARDVRDRDQDVDQMYNALFREFLTHMMEDPRNITACMHLHFIAKNIERCGDHVTSIAEQVIYLATGEMPSDNRPKADATSAQPIMEERG